QDVAVDAQSLELIEEQPRGGQMSRLYRVLNPAPEAWWPRSVEVAPGPVDAVRWVSFTADAVSDVVASTTVDHRPGGVVQMVENAPDRIVFDVESQGGLAVVRRAFQPLFKARDETGERLRTTAVNLLLLGVEVPDGRHRVTLEVSEWPEIGAGLVAIGVLLLCAFLGWRR
ncbi:MAG: hypothetical protein KDD11_02815, partial [Acidobacteria bacterium]|nr:hypothetical protein [Acidobacteriota bacterium]